LGLTVKRRRTEVKSLGAPEEGRSIEVQWFGTDRWWLGTDRESLRS
jgi:hypothetical protein